MGIAVFLAGVVVLVAWGAWRFRPPVGEADRP
ncbi:DUF4175 domain-containing protein [Actinomadura kijaniata]|nr:DUF4175 domain-containing protein [Actinomadura kijaniata]